jgi:hypothetical protein
LTTSGVTTGLMTARQIAQAALEQLNYLDPAESASDADATVCLRVLNWMLKTMQADGINLWREATTSITWPGATAEQALAANYIDVRACRFQQSTTFERPMGRMELDDYKALPYKSQAGDPLMFCPIKQSGTLRMAVWPVPASSVTLNLDVARVIEDVTALAQNVDLPQEWTEAVYTNVADRMPASYKAALSGIDRQDLTVRAQSLYSLMRDADRPGSYVLTR